MCQVLERIDLGRRVLDRQVRKERAVVRVDEHEARHAPSADRDAYCRTFEARISTLAEITASLPITTQFFYVSFTLSCRYAQQVERFVFHGLRHGFVGAHAFRIDVDDEPYSEHDGQKRQQNPNPHLAFIYNEMAHLLTGTDQQLY